MNQATLELTTAPQGYSADTTDGVGFQIGWDHAHHGLVPPAELLLDTTPLGQGWRAGKAVFGARTLAATRATRQWLALRVRAWREGIAFESQLVTAHFIAQLHTDRCPVTRQPLGGAAGAPDAAVIDRLNPQAGYAAGNLALISQRAADARSGVDVLESLRRARRAADTGDLVEGLDAATWWRLAALRAFATPLPLHEVARLPLALLPPNRVRLLNPAQGLQALVSSQFLAPGWSARARAFAELLPAHTVRHDFNLFIGALAPRVLEAGGEAAALRGALENAWLNERVQRRWQHVVLSLGEEATAALLERAAKAGLAGMRTLHHAPAQATEGWALEGAGRADRTSPADGAAGRVRRRLSLAWQQPAGRRGTAPSPSAPATRA